MNLKLNEREEIVGTLVDMYNKNGMLTLIFSIFKRLELPTSAIHKEKLQEYLGKRIGILNLDGDYKIRTIRRK